MMIDVLFCWYLILKGNWVQFGFIKQNTGIVVCRFYFSIFIMKFLFIWEMEYPKRYNL